MNYEQKYKEALKIMESLHSVVKYQSSSDALLTSQTIEKAFPELCESEDERIRKELYRYFCDLQLNSDREFSPSISIDEILDWLERRNEQKFAWSEEDEKGLGDALWAIQQARTIAKDENDMGNLWYAENWLKSIKDRVQPHPEQEWSEEDEQMIRSIRCYLNEFGNWLSDKNEEKSQSIYKACDWLKSIKPNHWKPSEQNIKDLEWCADLVKDKMGVGFHRLQVFIDELKQL